MEVHSNENESNQVEDKIITSTNTVTNNHINNNDIHTINIEGLNGSKENQVFTYKVNDFIKLLETPKEEAEHALKNLSGIEGIANALHVKLDYGLDTTSLLDLKNRRTAYGKNYIEPPKARTIWELMWDAFQDLTVIVLTCAGFISLVLGLTVDEEHRDTGWIEGFSVLVAVFIVVFVTALNDYQKEKQFQALNAVKEDEKIKVIRDGQPKEISKYDILVGDICRIELGDILPADGIVFDENDLKIDESSMTGESILITKNKIKNPFLLSNTKVMEGMGKMLVICVGEHSQSGIISKLITHSNSNSNSNKKSKNDTNKTNTSTTTNNIEMDKIDNNTNNQKITTTDYITVHTPKSKEINKSDNHTNTNEKEIEIESPLQGKLNKLTIMIGKLGTFVSVLVFIAMSIRFSIETFGIDKKPWKKKYAKNYLDFFVVSITVLVVAIPEGLPLAVTIALAYSVKKMLKDNNLVRHLDACETMGSATTICSDKTGTLTTNRMTVMKCWLNGNELIDTNNKLSNVNNINSITMDLICIGICVNSTAEILPPKINGAQPEHTGNKTECALLQFCSDLSSNKYNYTDIRKKNNIQHMITFSSQKKRMSVIISGNNSLNQNNNNKSRVFTKGATEIVLGLCTKIIKEDGTIKILTEDDKKSIITNVIDKYASEGLRTLCLAYRDLDYDYSDINNKNKDNDDTIESDLTCLIIVGIEDPVREEVPLAIEKCKKAGIIVRMVTGDNLITAKSIAFKCGIIHNNDGSLIMEGKKFREKVVHKETGEIIQEEFDKIWPMLRVLARSSPKDKHTLVTGIIQSKLSNHGPQVVAVTGDGTNDAPALKRADVGFAMGISGTAVAKDASDIILMDDNFNSIVNAVKWGRNVYDSISKFLQFQLTVNVVAITVAVVGAITIEESPLSAVQLLWVNLIMDTFASLALATEPPVESLLNRKPYGRDKPLLSKTMTKHIIGQSIYQLVILFGLVYGGEKIFSFKSGRKQDLPDDYNNEPTTHYTMVFNTFVFLQLFNELNARKIHDELNIFDGIINNHTFILIGIFQIFMQAIITEFGGRPFGTTGLSGYEWGICLALGAGSLPIGFLLRLIRTNELPSWMALCKETESFPEISSRGQELWVRGFSRVRTQIKVVNAFKKSIYSD